MSTRIAAGNVRLKRADQQSARADGIRVLVDRSWPRGVKKAAAAVDYWAKELAPSTALAKWFDHNPSRWLAFRHRYAKEVRQHRDEFKTLRALARMRRITLVYSAHDEARNDAVELRALLLGGHTRRRSTGVSPNS